jgi:hypothetical protein
MEIKINRADAVILNQTTVTCKNGMQFSRAAHSLADNKIAEHKQKSHVRRSIQLDLLRI